jgi:succinate dehydrogenase (ubiquinone) membrane anchor subunit
MEHRQWNERDDVRGGPYADNLNRIVSAGLVPLTIAPFAAGSLNPITDSILCALLVVHSHIGFEYVSQTKWSIDCCRRSSRIRQKLTHNRSCVIDYFPAKRVPFVRNAAMWALRIGTITLGVALYSFETNDVGITEAVARLWKA